MSDSRGGEIAALTIQAYELQKSLGTVERRLDELRREGPTAIIPRDAAPAWWKSPVFVGVSSSAMTALVIGLFFAVTAVQSDKLASFPPLPEPRDAPPPVHTLEPLPVPVPVLVQPQPPLPVRIAPPVGAHLGALTVVCLPLKCDSIVDNGVDLGPGHIFSRPTTPGRHSLLLHAPNGVRKLVSVEVSPDQLKDVRMSMSD